MFFYNRIIAFLCYFEIIFGQYLANRYARPTGQINQTCLDNLNISNKEQNDLENCEFMKCFENRFPCGSNYWIMHWGYKYCVRYADQEFRNKINSKGVEMINEMNLCMAKHLVSFYVSNKSLNCKNLYKLAFQLQAQCYMNMGDKFCEAFRENGSEMMKKIDRSDIMNSYSMKMINKATSICKPEINLIQLLP